MQMKQHELYWNNVAQTVKSKGDFLVAGLNAKVPLNELEAKAESLFVSAPPPALPLFPNAL
jgi:hypothetical protein